MFVCKIHGPKNLAFYRKGESIKVYGEVLAEAKSVALAGVCIRVGGRTKECDLMRDDEAGGRVRYRFEVVYRLGLGIKRIVFGGSTSDGKQIKLGVRYVLGGSEDIGPRITIPWRARSLESGVNLVGPLAYALGLGEAARGTARVLQDEGFPSVALAAPSVLNCGKCDDFKVDALGVDLRYYINLFHLNPPEMISVRKHWPRVFRNGQYNIGYWYCELPQLPQSWHAGFAGLREIWVASHFVETAIKAVSPIPVHVIPPLVLVCMPDLIDRREFGLPDDKICILSVFDLNSYSCRKNPEGSVRAFKLACEANRNLHLVLKVNNGDRNSKALNSLRESLAGFDNVTFILANLSRPALTRLQAMCDLFISLHRAEGFGLNLAECMALGKPVIATNWSANVDFMDAANSCPVDYSLVQLEETFGPYEKGQFWADPCIEQAARHILMLAGDREMRAALGRRAQATIQEKYSTTAVAAAIRRRYAAIVAGR